MIEKPIISVGKIHVYQYIMPIIESNMYVLISINCDTAIVIDPNVSEKALECIDSYGIKKIYVLLSHEHYDHISGVNWLKGHYEVLVICSRNCSLNIENASKSLAKYTEVIHPIVLESNELQYELEYSCRSDIVFDNEYELVWNDIKFKMVEAPGHSNGGIVIFMDNRYVFTGDNLVNNGLGVITRWPGGDKEKFLTITKPLIESIDRDVMIFPGHGKVDKLNKMIQYLKIYTNRLE